MPRVCAGSSRASRRRPRGQRTSSRQRADLAASITAQTVLPWTRDGNTPQHASQRPHHQQPTIAQRVLQGITVRGQLGDPEVVRAIVVHGDPDPVSTRLKVRSRTVSASQDGVGDELTDDEVRGPDQVLHLPAAQRPAGERPRVVGRPGAAVVRKVMLRCWCGTTSWARSSPSSSERASRTRSMMVGGSRGRGPSPGQAHRPPRPCRATRRGSAATGSSTSDSRRVSCRTLVQVEDHDLWVLGEHVLELADDVGGQPIAAGDPDDPGSRGFCAERHRSCGHHPAPFRAREFATRAPSGAGRPGPDRLRARCEFAAHQAHTRAREVRTRNLRTG